MAEPRLLAIDELSLGLAPLVVEQLVEFLVRLNDEEGVAILLVDQNARSGLRALRARVRAGDGAVGARGPERGARDPARGAERLPRRRLGAARVTTFLQLSSSASRPDRFSRIVGMALVLVYRTTGIVNFAQGVFCGPRRSPHLRALRQHMPLALAIVVRDPPRCASGDAPRGRRRRLPRPHDASRESRSSRSGSRCWPRRCSAGDVRRGSALLPRHLGARLGHRRRPRPAAVRAHHSRRSCWQPSV